MIRVAPRTNSFVVTVLDESRYGSREERSDDMVFPLTKLLEEKSKACETIQLFSAGSSMGEEFRNVLIGGVKSGIVKAVVIQGIEMSLPEVMNLANCVLDAGGRIMWISGCSDNTVAGENWLHIISNGYPSSEKMLASQCFVGAIDDQIVPGVNIIHECDIDHASSVCQMMLHADPDPFVIVRFVHTDSTIYTHDNIGIIKVGNILVGGLQSGDAWLTKDSPNN